MNVLICCEESQVVCKAFRERGFNAFSCDLQPCSGGFPEWHIQAPCQLVYHSNSSFVVQSGEKHTVLFWDLVIAHPPCTYLSKAGTRSYFHGGFNLHRYSLGLSAAEFFMSFYKLDCKYLAIENPVPLRMFDLPPYSQIIQPFFFGDSFYKTTCLWLRGLPLLVLDNVVENPVPCMSASWFNKGSGLIRQKNRSKTFPGIARAMASQWGVFMLNGGFSPYQLSFW